MNAGARRRLRGPWAVHALALAVYTLAAVAATWALVADLGAAVPGDPESDYYQTHWALWWVRFALSRGFDPMFTDWTLFPLRQNLSIHMLTPSLMPAYALLEPVAGRVAAVNLITVGILVLSAYMMFVFLRGHLPSLPWREEGIRGEGRTWATDALARVGGFVFGFMPYQIFHTAASHLNLTPIFWLPLALWLWDRVVRTEDARRQAAWAAALGVAIWGAWLTDLQYLMWLGLIAVPYGLYTLVRADDRRRRLKLAACAALAAAVTLALGAIAPLPALAQMDASQFAPADLYVPRLFSMPPGALFFAPGPDDKGFGRMLVALTFGGVIVSLARSRRVAHGSPIDGRWLWLALAIIPFALALGPDVEIVGQAIPLPYRALHDLMGGQYRSPVRFSVPGIFALIVFCALAWRPVAARVRRPLVRAGLVVVALALFTLDLGLLESFPTLKPRDYAIYHEIGQEPGDWVIFEIPTGIYSGWTGFGYGKTLMYYAPVHQKRLVNGSLSRIPAAYHLEYEQSALLTGFAGNELDTQAVPRELAQAVDEWPAGYVIVHPDLLPSERLWEYVGLLNTQDAICFYKAEEGLLIYRAHWHPGGCPPRTPPPDASGAYVLDFGEPGDAAFVGEYWYRAEDVGGVQARWAGSNDASRVRVELPVGGYMVTLVGTGYGAGQAVEVRANGVVLGECELGEGWRECEVRLPAAVVGEGEVLLVLSHRAPETAPDGRTLTAAYDRIIFTPVVTADAR